MEAFFRFLPYVWSSFSWRLIQLFRASSVGFSPLTIAAEMNGLIGFRRLSIITFRFDLPRTLISLILPVPSWLRRTRAIPSTDHKSGRLLSLTSIETASPSSDSTSPLTYPKISLRPSLSRATAFPRRSSRSVSENCTLGV